jgi:hypothetical protein
MAYLDGNMVLPSLAGSFSHLASAQLPKMLKVYNAMVVKQS